MERQQYPAWYDLNGGLGTIFTPYLGLFSNQESTSWSFTAKTHKFINQLLLFRRQDSISKFQFDKRRPFVTDPELVGEHLQWAVRAI